jgi:hypothetical protein
LLPNNQILLQRIAKLIAMNYAISENEVLSSILSYNSIDLAIERLQNTDNSLDSNKLA